MSMGTQERIVDLVHRCYWERNANCAYTTLYCLEHLTGQPVHPQLYQAVRGCHGAGGMGGQCGLVEGALLFLGLYGEVLGKNDEEVVALCVMPLCLPGSSAASTVATCAPAAFAPMIRRTCASASRSEP